MDIVPVTATTPPFLFVGSPLLFNMYVSPFNSHPTEFIYYPPHHAFPDYRPGTNRWDGAEGTFPGKTVRSQTDVDHASVGVSGFGGRQFWAWACRQSNRQTGRDRVIVACSIVGMPHPEHGHLHNYLEPTPGGWAGVVVTFVPNGVLS